MRKKKDDIRFHWADTINSSTNGEFWFDIEEHFTVEHKVNKEKEACLIIVFLIVGSDCVVHLKFKLEKYNICVVKFKRYPYFWKANTRQNTEIFFFLWSGIEF